MAIEVTATEAKTKMLALLNDVERGEHINITRHGRLIARIVPARGARVSEGIMAGIAHTMAPEEALFSTGEAWEAE